MKGIEKLPDFILKFGVSLGIAVFILGTFATALGAGGGNVIPELLTMLETWVTTYVPPILAIVAIVVIYGMVKGVQNKGGH